MQYLIIFNALLALLEKLLPPIAEAVKAGEITKEEQQATRDRYLALRAQGDVAFSGPAWTPSAPNDGQV